MYSWVILWHWYIVVITEVHWDMLAGCILYWWKTVITGEPYGFAQAWQNTGKIGKAAMSATSYNWKYTEFKGCKTVEQQVAWIWNTTKNKWFVHKKPENSVHGIQYVIVAILKQFAGCWWKWSLPWPPDHQNDGIPCPVYCENCYHIWTTSRCSGTCCCSGICACYCFYCRPTI